MKIPNDTSVIETNITSKQGFGIIANAKAFNILSNSLYSNKIAAIIRELSTNARDSHIAADKTLVPFDVQLPNLLETVFSVRDYGTGMDHEDVMHLYTTYFDSTKTQSNDFIGALGLGSKSPFSYTQSFSVISWYNGYESVYLCYMSKGYPNISFISKKESSEHNGIKVSLNVNKTDISSFHIFAKKIFSVFDIPLPNITGVPSDFKVDEHDVFKIDFLPENIYYSPNNNLCSFVKQGCISYPLNSSSLNTYDVLKNINFSFNCDNNTKEKLIGLFVNNRFCINANIGEFDIAASREALSYEEQTFTSFAYYISIFYNNIYDFFDKLYKKSKSIIEFVKNICEYFSQTKTNHLLNFWNACFNCMCSHFSFADVQHQSIYSINVDFNKLFDVDVYTHEYYVKKYTTIRKKQLTTKRNSGLQLLALLHAKFVYYDPMYGILKNTKFIRNSVFMQNPQNSVIVIPYEHINKMKKICDVEPAHLLQQRDVQNSFNSKTTHRGNVSYYEYAGSYSHSSLNSKKMYACDLESTLTELKKRNAVVLYAVQEYDNKTWKPLILNTSISNNTFITNKKIVSNDDFRSRFNKLRNFYITPHNVLHRNLGKTLITNYLFLIKPKQKQLFDSLGGVDFYKIEKEIFDETKNIILRYNRYNVNNRFTKNVCSIIENSNMLHKNIDITKVYRCCVKINNKLYSLRRLYSNAIELLECFANYNISKEQYEKAFSYCSRNSIFKKSLDNKVNLVENKYPILFAQNDVDYTSQPENYFKDLEDYVLYKNENFGK